MSSDMASLAYAVADGAAEYQLAKHSPQAFLEYQKMKLKISIVIMSVIILLFIGFAIYSCISIDNQNKHNKMLNNVALRAR